MSSANLFVGVNAPSESRNLSDLEKKHVPVITAPETVNVGEQLDVTVEVGAWFPHPCDHKHFVQFVELHADDTRLARVDLTDAAVRPKVTISVALSQPVSQLRAYGRCNMHGMWLGTRPIRLAEE